MAREKDVQLQNIAEELAGIREALEDISEEISELHQSIMVVGILKIAEIKPEMREKMEPLFNELASGLDMSLIEDE